jgi:hypothetical protein
LKQFTEMKKVLQMIGSGGMGAAMKGMKNMPQMRGGMPQMPQGVPGMKKRKKGGPWGLIKAR